MFVGLQSVYSLGRGKARPTDRSLNLGVLQRAGAGPALHTRKATLSSLELITGEFAGSASEAYLQCCMLKG